MIRTKLLMWVGAGLLSVASVPAIAATRTHRAKNLHATPVKHVAAIHSPFIKTAVKTASHAKSTKLVAASKKSHKLAKSVKTVAHTSLGVTAMHSGHAKLTKPVIASAKSSGSRLLAASTKVKLAH
jgi:hypothetical protein